MEYRSINWSSSSLSKKVFSLVLNLSKTLCLFSYKHTTRGQGIHINTQYSSKTKEMHILM